MVYRHMYWYDNRIERGSPMITMYTKNNCKFCKMSKALLESNNIEYEEVNIEDDQDHKMFLIEQGHRTVPQFYIDVDICLDGGYAELKKHLKQRGLI